MEENYRLASAGADIKVWETSTLSLLKTFEPHSQPARISSLSWSPNSIL